jgi:serine phosphatase RsbU (regulator of sigma subunit)
VAEPDPNGFHGHPPAADTPSPLEPHSSLSRFLQAIVDAAPDGVLAVSPRREVLAVNRRFCELFRLPPGLVEVGGPSPALGEAQLSRISDPAGFQAAIEWGHRNPYATQTLDVQLRDGRIIEGYAAPILDDQDRYLGRVWYLHDETDRRAAETQRASLVAELAAAQRAQRFLLDASEVLARATGFTETLELLAQVAVPTLGDLCLIDVVDERGQVSRAAAEHADPAQDELVAQLRAWPPDPADEHPGIQAMRHGVSRWAADMPDGFLQATVRGPQHLDVIRRMQFTSYMAVPLMAEGRVLGAVTLVSAGSGRRFGPDDLALAEELARRVALVVDKERRYDRERRASHALQASLLPHHVPSIPGVEVAVRYLPTTRDAEVGGDFWDLGVLADDKAVFLVGDVAGHDMTAAATMAQLRSACRALRAQAAGPGELITLLQGTWEALGLERIATAVFACLDLRTGHLEVASAGHPPPLLVQGSSAWFPGLLPAPPLGAPPSDPVTWRGTLPVGAAMVFFTDGLVEDRHREIEVGMGRLADAAVSVADAEGAAGCAEVLADHILAAMSGEERSDDVAVMVVRRTAEHPDAGA